MGDFVGTAIFAHEGVQRRGSVDAVKVKACNKGAVGFQDVLHLLHSDKVIDEDRFILVSKRDVKITVRNTDVRPPVYISAEKGADFFKHISF